MHEAEEEPRALQIRQLGKLAKQRVFGFKSFGAPGTDVLWRAYGGAQSHEATLLRGPVATPDRGPQFCDSGRRRATFVIENSRLAQVGGYAGMCACNHCMHPEHLRWTWSTQVRWVMLGRHVHPDPQVVSTSPPQGRACAPLVLNLVLATPARRIARDTSGHVVHSLFLDDISFLADDPGRAVDTIQRWEEGLSNFGLHEIADKMAVLRSNLQQQQVMIARVPARAFHVEVKVLGVSFQRSLGEVSSSAAQHHTTAQSILSRVAMLPFPGPFRAQVYRFRVSPYLVRGHWLEAPSNEFLPAVDHSGQAYNACTEAGVPAFMASFARTLDRPGAQVQFGCDELL